MLTAFPYAYYTCHFILILIVYTRLLVLALFTCHILDKCVY